MTALRDFVALLQDYDRPSTPRQRAAVVLLLTLGFIALTVRPA
jgi:hypothetical protein